MKKLVSIILALAMCMVLCVSGSATDIPNADGYLDIIWDIDAEGNKIPIIVDEIDDGSHDDETAVPLGAAYVMFTMKLEAMKHSLHTKDDSYFTKNNLTRGNLLIQGMINSDNVDGIVGLAYYDGGFHPANSYLNIVECGQYFEFSYPQSSFSPYYYYYGYAQSRDPGTAPYSGTIHYCNSDW